jgi:hypothetical protein
MGGAVQLGEIPRGSCQNTLSFNTEVEAHDKEIAAYNKRHPEQQEAFETDTVSQMAGQPETEAAMAHGLGVSSDLVHEMDALG